MKIRLINRETEDYIILEEESIEEIRATASIEMKKRGWKAEDCYSEKTK